MSRDAGSRERSLENVRTGMIEHLRAAQPDIVAAIVTRVAGVAGSAESEDAEYQVGLRVAVAAVVDYFLTGVERGEDWSGPIPSPATTQARRAARSGVSLETLVLRYIAGHRLLGEFVMDEADRSGFSSHGSALRQMHRTQDSLLERLMTVIIHEHRKELERWGRSTEQHRRELTQKLLAGEHVDSADLDYNFDAWHLGMVAIGTSANLVVRDLAEILACQLLLVPRSDTSWSVWLGKQQEFAITDIERSLAAKAPTSVSLAVGEVANRIEGWRQTHRQAEEALWVALRAPRTLTRYADVLLLAAALRDEVLAQSLKEIYLWPLGGQKNSGVILRQTLRAYFETEHNARAVSAKLDVDRSTVGKRLRIVEERLGRPLHTCQAELAVALRLEELDESCGQ